VQKDSENSENKNHDDMVTVEPEAEKMDTSEVVTNKVAEIATNNADRVMDSEKDKEEPTESAEKLRSEQKASAGMPKINLLKLFTGLLISFQALYMNCLFRNYQMKKKVSSSQCLKFLITLTKHSLSYSLKRGLRSISRFTFVPITGYLIAKWVK
jgi:hypothetical protein